MTSGGLTERNRTGLGGRPPWAPMAYGRYWPGGAAPRNPPMTYGPPPSSRRGGPPLHGAGQGPGVHLVRVEPPQFLLQEFGRFPAVQGDPALGLPGAAQVRDAPVRPGDHDLPFAGGEADLGDARPGGGLAGDLDPVRVRKPGRDQ